MVFKWLIRFLAYLGGMLMLLIALAYITGYSYLIKGVRLSYLSGHKSANIYDGNDFDTRKIANSNYVSALPQSYRFNKVPLSQALVNMLQKTQTTSFLVYKKDSLVSEFYYLGHNDTTKSNSFSMAKSITTLLVQQAIQSGKIPGWDTKVNTYLPWIKGAYANELTLHHLSTMTAGLDWNESYVNPLSITARLYYGDDVVKTLQKVSVVNKPGQNYIYQSGATQLLGLCLSKAVGMSVSEFASAQLWQNLGAEMPATWHTDHENGNELTYCCFNAISRDFVRLGALLLHHGKSLKNEQLVDSSFIALATQKNKVAWYGKSFWVGKSAEQDWFMMHGTQGQFIIVIPKSQLVIVRTGHKTEKDPKSKIPACAQLYADETVQLFGLSSK